jgi:glycosyltransferase involved in cell wall biosynthesis
MKKVLVISFYYYQHDQIGSIRINGLIKYLPLFGWEPVILTIQPKNNFPTQGRVITTEYSEIDAFFLKLFGINQNNPHYSQKNFLFNKKIYKFTKYILYIYKEIFYYPDAQIKWKYLAINESTNLLQKEHFDAIFSSAMPYTAHIIASTIKKTFNIPWIADFRDLWTQNHIFKRTPIRKLIELKLEKRTLSKADAIITVSNPLAHNLSVLHKNNPIYVIPNGFDIDQINPGIPLSLNFSINYTGVLYQGRQDPEPLFKIIRYLINENKIDPELIKINFFGRIEDWLFDDVKKYQLEKIVKIHGVISREDSIQKQREAQILLLLTWNDPNEKGVYTGKLFDYLAARRPILSIGYTDGGVVKELLDQTKAGVHCSTEEELREYLLNAYREYKELGAVQYHGIEEEIMKYSHVEMARKFAAVLDEVTLNTNHHAG